ncbi:MAG: peptide chain release factor N(5)-glutamine methyltransferase [Planctomycetales bacterium]
MQAPAADQWTVRRILEWTTAHLAQHGSDSPRLDAEILLAHARGCRRIDLYTRFDEVLTDAQRATMRNLVRRRAKAEPVAYLVGHREFYGLDFRVTPDVFIPRPDTETLVMELIRAAKEVSEGEPRILDVGTGSGCIAIAAAVNCPRAQITAIEQSPAALAIARENAAKHGVAERIRFLEGRLFGPLEPGETFHCIASNPPYVPESERETIQPDVRLHEPHAALFSGPDGLDAIRQLVAEAPSHFEPGGRLMFEIAPEQEPAVRALLESTGRYAEMAPLRDLPGKIRVVRARYTPVTGGPSKSP